jgi:transcription initiation factor TFIID subunit 5
MYPIFVHVYLELIGRGNDSEAAKFMRAHCVEHEQHHKADLERLRAVTTADLMGNSEIVDAFRKNKFGVRLCSYSDELLRTHLQEQQFTALSAIINRHIDIKTFHGNPRQKHVAGGVLGAGTDIVDNINKKKIYWGSFSVAEDDDDIDDGDNDDHGDGRRPKRKKQQEQVVPPRERVPYPRPRGRDLEARSRIQRDMKNRIDLGSGSLPSCCMYTCFNANEAITTMTIATDATLLSAGFADAYVRLWSLDGKGLKSLLPADQLDRMQEYDELFDFDSVEPFCTLYGHSGPVYATRFSVDNSVLLSCSEDTTIRLWNTATYSNVACYRGHSYPVWDCAFSPTGLYFASASHDRTARVWSMDVGTPLRIFAGHFFDVDCVEFHPNGNYVATGSSDRSCRLWDVQTRECVRVFQGHSGTVHALAFSEDGQYLASAGDDNNVIVWDLSQGKALKTLRGHRESITSLTFSGGSSLLVSGSLDCTVRVWDARGVVSSRDDFVGEEEDEDLEGEESHELLATYTTKSTPVHTVQFTPANLLLAGGVFAPQG